MAIYKTPFGPVRYSTIPSEARAICYGSSIYSAAPFSKRHSVIKAQPAFVKGFREAEDRLGKRIAQANGWDPKKAKAHAIELTGIGWRDYDAQYTLWRGDSKRYAPPWVSGHVQGVAIDVSTAQPYLDLIAEVLYNCGFRRVRVDEPWHWSLGVVT
jgi:hypothetical protein